MFNILNFLVAIFCALVTWQSLHNYSKFKKRVFLLLASITGIFMLINLFFTFF